MSKKTLYIIAMVLFFFSAFNLRAQNDEPVPVDEKLKKEVVSTVVNGYTPWEKISISGKLSTSLLPISPSVKIYMEKGSLVVISVSSFWTGEAARIEVDREKTLLVNEMSNTYTVVPNEKIESVCPGGLDALQNMLLRRITILGQGELRHSAGDSLDIYEVPGEALLLLPAQDLENASYIYAYFLNPTSYALDRFVVMSPDESGMVNVTYTNENKDTVMKFEASMGSLPMNASLKLNRPDSNPKKISRIDLGPNYREVDLRGIFKM